LIWAIANWPPYTENRADAENRSSRRGGVNDGSRALSQKLVNSVIQGPQMLLLDEPFAFFDDCRTASALNLLSRTSGDFTRIWVTSQETGKRVGRTQ
jgi:hypothetical protein